MSSKVSLTLACGDYEIVRALKEGSVQPDGIELTVLTRSDSSTRHWRFFRNMEYDVAECSASTYILSRDRALPYRALPVFLHRRFRHGFVYINTTKGIKVPRDLIGRKVGIKSYQTTAVLWLRGMLEEEYGVPSQSIEWLAELDEGIPFTPPPGIRFGVIPHDCSLETMLAQGDIDALIHPDIIQPVLQKDPRVGRLFPQYKEEELRYFSRTGIFPIMHVMGVRQDLVEQHPWIVRNLYQAFDESKEMAMRRMANPRVAPLAWYQAAWEEQAQILGSDPWQYGLTARNRVTLETLVRYSHASGLMRQVMPLEELFLSVDVGRKRGRFSV